MTNFRASDGPSMNQARQLARRFLPAPVRKTLGAAAGRFYHTVIRWFQGAAFDSAAAFRADGCIFSIPKDQTSRTYRSCFLDGSYEAEERALIREFVRPSDAVLELGACLASCRASQTRFSLNKSKHVVVEGNPYCMRRCIATAN